MTQDPISRTARHGFSTVRLAAIDRAALATHLLALESGDRRLRFGSGISDAAMREYAARIDFARDGLFAVQDDDLSLLALVHVAFGGTAAELGLSVLPDRRGRGLGSALFRRAITFLRNRGANSVFVHCLAENGAMLHLARKHGMRLVHAGGESEARLALPPANLDSMVAEWLDDQRGRAIQALRRHARLASLVLGPVAP